MRQFNTTGLCVPDMHYMVDISDKISEIAEMVDRGLYFTINRARQYGKTTTLFMLRQKLREKYLVVDTSFEGMGSSPFNGVEAFCAMFTELFANGLRKAKTDAGTVSGWESWTVHDISGLSKKVTAFCESAGKPVVMLIDEVDKTSDNQVFVDFLGMLRSKYLDRNKGDDCTFHSVVLAGVYDIKNLKLKITGERALEARGERRFNSPWNIAAEFDVDMSFQPAGIATMLDAYERDHHTGMDTAEISESIHRYTNGYPFLVSRICQIIDSRMSIAWTAGGVEDAVKLLLKEDNTLFSDMFRNIEENPKLHDLIFDVVMGGVDRSFAVGNPQVDLGRMFGILIDNKGSVAVSNLVFELLIINYLVSEMESKSSIFSLVPKNEVIEGGMLNLKLIMEKFAQHYHELYDDNNQEFLEKNGRLLFITYLRPFINGAGFYHIESGTRGLQRMDLVIDYGVRQFIIEMKIWRGTKKHQDAYAQLCDYLDAKNASEGYLLTFDFRKGARQRKAEWIEFRGKRIFDVIV